MSWWSILRMHQGKISEYTFLSFKYIFFWRFGSNVSKNWSARNPVVLLATAFRELLHSKRPITGKRLQPFIWIEIFLLNFSFDNMFAGSSTACVLFLDHDSSRLFTVNIGDSGFLVVRKGRVVHQSEEQQHYFNTPFQLALPPPGHDGSALNDRY